MKTSHVTTAAALLVSILVSAGSAFAQDISEKDVLAIWKKECSSCHAMNGNGKTRAGRKAKVEDLTDAKYQKKFTDKQMFEQIKNGMKDKEGKEQMKAYGEKLKDAEIKALIAFVRTLDDEKK